MRNKILYAVLVIAIIAVSGYNMYLAQTKEMMTDLTLANVEALADEDDGDDYETCGTHEKLVDDTLPCPNSNGKFGRKGTEYSKTTGISRTYKTGFNGTYYRCSHPETENVDNIKEYPCNE